MFEVKKHKALINGLHEIVDNEVSLFNDGDNDILYTGTNKFGNRLLGSIVFEDRSNRFLRYFHILITEDIYLAFLHKEKTLRSILEESESFFIIDKGFDDAIIDYNLISIQDIPDRFLPLNNSYCPSFVYDASLDYVFSLKGGLADVHKAEPEVMSEMNSKLCAFIKSSAAFLHHLDIHPHVYSEPAMTGSFELNFRIELNEQQSLFSRDTNSDVKNFILNLYKYIFNELPKEDAGALKSDNIQSDLFNQMKSEFELIHKERQRLLEGGREAQLIDIITESVENFKNVSYTGFESIEVLNRSESGTKLPVAIIKDNYYNSVENKIFKLEVENKPPIVEIDEQPVEYNIEVFDLNRESGNGLIYLSVKGADTRIRGVSLYLRGKDHYENTIFTQSMHDKSIISIKGIAKKVDGVYKSITFNYEN